ncbi:hypothetical protein G5I_11831 [Acromyrmex echinatior]|uniref:Uncharacterized protein n=1 Tax=Acromyrmex echinatior TaxID=103372 RepID=F4X0P8_ACREC|nr:hypothetical protein G5I_11831 [Acromyrmex echinatior]
MPCDGPSSLLSFRPVRGAGTDVKEKRFTEDDQWSLRVCRRNQSHCGNVRYPGLSDKKHQTKPPARKAPALLHPLSSVSTSRPSCNIDRIFSVGIDRSTHRSPRKRLPGEGKVIGNTCPRGYRHVTDALSFYGSSFFLWGLDVPIGGHCHRKNSCRMVTNSDRISSMDISNEK